MARGTSSKVIEALADGRPMGTAEFAAMGISRVTLHRMVEAGEIDRVAHGVYRRVEPSESQHADWAALSRRIPSAVVCLTSAAAFHRMTQDMAYALEIAVPREVGQVRVGSSFPTRVEVMHWRSPDAFTEGVQTHVIDGVPVRITSPERTVVDMFRFSSLNPSHPRHRMVRVTDEAFLDTLHRALDAHSRIADIDEVVRIADVFNVRKRMSPYFKTYNFSAGRGFEA